MSIYAVNDNNEIILPPVDWKFAREEPDNVIPGRTVVGAGEVVIRGATHKQYRMTIEDGNDDTPAMWWFCNETSKFSTPIVFSAHKAHDCISKLNQMHKTLEIARLLSGTGHVTLATSSFDECETLEIHRSSPTELLLSQERSCLDFEFTCEKEVIDNFLRFLIILNIHWSKTLEDSPSDTEPINAITMADITPARVGS